MPVSTFVVEEEVAAATAMAEERLPAAHRAAESGFDYAKAKLSGMSYYYRSGEDTYHYAIGKDNWMPLPMAAMLLGDRFDPAYKIIAAYAQSQLWLHADSAVFQDWWGRNAPVIARMCALEWSPPANELPTAWPQQFAFLRPAEVSYQYRLCWERLYPKMPDDFLAITDAHAAFESLPAVRGVQIGLQDLKTILNGFVATWFESQGFTVDREQHLVSVEGYQTLFYCAEQAY